MKNDDSYLSPDMSIMTVGDLAPRAKLAFLALAVGLLGVVGILHLDAWSALVSVWARSVSYNHCFLVFPVSVWLIYRERASLSSMNFRPYWPGLVLLALLAGVWLFATVAGVNSLRDFATVATVPVLCVTLLGADFGRAMRFPLAFMLFAWPFGEVLIPPFIDLTADFTVMALRLTGVPLYREGNTFVLPTGQWSVVQECSGIRYLMASAFAGTVFAHLHMRSRRRWIAFVALSVAVPIVANWVRAYLTVLLGHLTENRLAVGVDHLIYGWVFFGIVMTGVFVIGARMADDGQPQPAKPRPRPSTNTATSGRVYGFAVVLVFVAAGIGPAWKFVLSSIPAGLDAASAKILLPSAHGDWRSTEVPPDQWVPPESATAQSSAVAAYGEGSHVVTLHVSMSTELDAEKKVLAYTVTTLSDYDVAVKVVGRRIVDLPQVRPALRVVEKVVRNDAGAVVVWYWYHTADEWTEDVWRARFARAIHVLSGRSPLVEVWTAVAPFRDNPSTARASLERFLVAHKGLFARNAVSPASARPVLPLSPSADAVACRSSSCTEVVRARAHVRGICEVRSEPRTPSGYANDHRTGCPLRS